MEELRVPIFTTPGNHDYRRHPYFLIFDLHPSVLGVGKDLKRVENYQPYLDVGEAARMVEVDPDIDDYRALLNDPASHVVELGKHRLAMLGSAHDVGMVNSATEALLEYLGLLGEDEATFLGGSPDCKGPPQADIDFVARNLAETPDDGLFRLGLHAPVFNPWNEEYPYFLRETQRP